MAQSHEEYLAKRRIRERALRARKRAEREGKDETVRTKKKTRRTRSRKVGRPSKYALFLPDGTIYKATKPQIRKRVQRLMDDGVSPDEIGLYEQRNLEVETITKVSFGG